MEPNEADLTNADLTPTTQIIEVSHEYAFLGPLPPPEILSKYKDIFKGSAERIFAMVEQRLQHELEQEKADFAHQREMEKLILESANRHGADGRVKGFFLSCLVIVVGAVIACVANAIAGAAVICTCCVGLAAVFARRTQAEPKATIGNQADPSRQPSQGTNPSTSQPPISQ